VDCIHREEELPARRSTLVSNKPVALEARTLCIASPISYRRLGLASTDNVPWFEEDAIGDGARSDGVTAAFRE